MNTNSTQIIDSGVSLKIVTGGIPKFITKSNIKTVEVLINTIIKIDIGKGALYNIYVNQPDVTVPSSSDVNDLRDKIHAMLQPLSSGVGGATEANQVLQTTELQNIKNSIINLNDKVNIVNDKVFFEPKLVDETHGSVVYKGFAVPGTVGADPYWAIQRVTNDSGTLSYHWASANKNFDKVWDQRTEYTYS